MKVITAFSVVSATVLQLASVAHAAQASGKSLEEVVVTAQRRAQSLQDVPVAVSAIDSQQIRALGIVGPSDLGSGIVPSLKIRPYFNGPDTLVVSMRGIGTADPAQITKEPGVGMYVDGVYLGRAQGLALGLADLKQIEVLRGPQGTLYGRNSLGGAVNMITAKPSGVFGIDQTLGYGSYNQFKSITHLSLPAVANISTKLSFLHNQNDGWVRNDYPGAKNFNYENINGGRAAVRWTPTSDFTVDYSFEKSAMKTTQGYFQFTGVPELAPGFTFFDPSLVESPGTDRSRIGVPLDPTKTDSDAHTLSLQWALNDNMTVKSITAYRSLSQDLFTNYGGVFALGLNHQTKLRQHQWSEELQLIGSTDTVNYTAGAFWYSEHARDDHHSFGTVAMSTLTGPNAVPVFAAPELFVVDPGSQTKVETISRALYGQATWTPSADALQKRLDLTLGLRYSQDRKSGERPLYYGVVDPSARFSIDTNHVDPMVSVGWQWTDELKTYIKWATGYRSGGANQLSVNFEPFGKEELSSYEVGLKSEWLDRRLRINGAAFKTIYKDKQVDFVNPANPNQTSTINASNGDVDISGLELSVDALIFEGLTASVEYNYLDANIKPQYNPFTGTSTRFEIQQAPHNSGSVQLAYQFPATPIGVLTASVVYTGSSAYYQNPRDFVHNDAWDLFNARLSLASIPLGDTPGDLDVALWAKNLTNEKYIQSGIAIAISDSAMYGPPRTLGIDVHYKY